jgi:hypothetical protein
MRIFLSGWVWAAAVAARPIARHTERVIERNAVFIEFLADNPFFEYFSLSISSKL